MNRTFFVADKQERGDSHWAEHIPPGEIIEKLADELANLFWAQLDFENKGRNKKKAK
jgi:hypothetical protein